MARGPGAFGEPNLRGRHISGVSQAAGQTGAAAGEVLDSAKMLARLSDDLKRDVDRFVGDLRAV